MKKNFFSILNKCGGMVCLILSGMGHADDSVNQPADFTQMTLPADKLDGLDLKLQQSLQSFDEMLLKEREILDNPEDKSISAKEWAKQQKNEETASQQQQQTGSGQDSQQGGQQTASGDQGQSGQAASASKGEGSQQAGNAVTGIGVAGGAESAEEAGSAKTAAAPGSGSGSGEPTAVSLPNRNNDDIVARQLREAAEQETDPELKAKLWEEYYRYKSGEQ